MLVLCDRTQEKRPKTSQSAMRPVNPLEALFPVDRRNDSALQEGAK